jgi:hypothetical protein
MTVAAVLAAYALVVFVLCPGDRLIGFPIHHDDFTNLSIAQWRAVSETYGFVSWPPRPVSYFALGALSAAGIPVYYLMLHLLVIAYVWLVLGLLRRLLQVGRMSLIATTAVAAAMLSYEHTVEYTKYTGLITNLLSATCAAGAMLVLMARAGEPQGRGRVPLRAKDVAAVSALAALSFWSKEDFILPVILLAAYLTWEGRRDSGGYDRRWWMLTGSLTLLAGACLFYQTAAASPFLTASVGPYISDFRPSSILRTGTTYLLMTPVSTFTTMLQASTLIVNGIAATPIRWTRLLLFHALVASLVVPYACLPNHLAPYYGLNWTVWQAGGALFLLGRLKPAAVPNVAWIVLAAVALAIGQSTRNSISQWYDVNARINRNIVTLLADHRSTLEPYRVVAVEGAPMLGPWFDNDGRFLRVRYGLDHEWLVRVSVGSEYRRRLLALRGSLEQGAVRTILLEEEPIPEGVPVLRLRADGTGTVDLP